MLSGEDLALQIWRWAGSKIVPKRWVSSYLVLTQPYFVIPDPKLHFIVFYHFVPRVVILAPFLLSPIILFSGDDPKIVEAMRCAYLIMLMAVYWMTEALPLPITSMIPMVGLPLLGLMSTGEVAINYLNSTNYMFLGGLIMAIAVEHCGLHNRVALKIIMLVRLMG